MMNVYECSLKKCRTQQFCFVGFKFYPTPNLQQTAVAYIPWCRRLGISGITESFLWPTGFQPDHWQNQRCPAGPDVTRKLASKKIHLIDGNRWNYKMLTSLRMEHHKGPMNCIYSFFKFDVIFGDYCIIVDFFKQAFFPSHHVGRSSTGSFPRGSAGVRQ